MAKTIVINNAGPRGPVGPRGEQGPSGSDANVPPLIISSSKQFTDITSPFTGSFSGSFAGDGSNLINVPASGVVGLDLSRISSGTATASISETGGLFVNTHITASGDISASSGTITALTGSFNHIITDNETLEFRSKASGARIGQLKFNPTNGLEVQDPAGARAKIRAARGEFLSLEAGPVGMNSIGSITASSDISASGKFIGDGSGLTNVFENTAVSSSLSSRITTSETNITNLQTDSGSFSTRISANEVVTAKTLISGSAQITAFGFVSQSGGIVDLPNVKIQYANVYPDLSDLPSPSNYHGMFAHVHATGKGYFAHAGAWIELANISVTSSIDDNRSLITGITSSLNTTGRMVFVGANGTLTSEAGFEYNATTNQLSVDNLNVNHLTSSFITSSQIFTSGSNIFGDASNDVQTLIGTTKMSGSAQVTGSLNASGIITGDGSGLTNIPASGIVGLNLSQIASGSATASIAPNKGLLINTDTTISGSLNMTGSVDIINSNPTTPSTGTVRMGSNIGLSNLYSIDLDGTDDLATATVSDNVIAGSKTVSFWMKLDAYDTTEMIMQIQGNNVGDYLNIKKHSSGTLQFGCRPAAVHGNTATGVDWESTLTNWTHVIVTKYKATYGYIDKIFINGVDRTNPAGAATVNGGTANQIKIGSIGSIGYYGSKLNGQIDELAIFDGHLTSSANINAIYNNGCVSDLSSLNPLVWYRMGDVVNASGSNIPDQGSNSEGDLVLTNDAHFVSGSNAAPAESDTLKVITSAGKFLSIGPKSDTYNQFKTDASKHIFNKDIEIEGGITGDAVSTASFGTYLGDGSNLSGISTTPFPFTGSADISGSLSVKGTSRTIYTSASIVYSNNLPIQVTQSFGNQKQQITNIIYSGTTPTSVEVTGSDSVNKKYAFTYTNGNITEIRVT